MQANASGRSQSPRRKRLGSCALGLAGVALLVLPQSASARTLTVFGCRTPTGAIAPTHGWSPSWIGTWITASDHCPAGGGLVAALNAGVAHAYQDEGHWTFRAPADTRIVGFSGLRASRVGAGQAFGAPLTIIGQDAGYVEACAQPFGCPGIGNPGAWNDPANTFAVGGLDSSSVYFVALCGGGAGGTCPAEDPSGVITMYRTEVALSDVHDPQVTAVSGGLATDEPLRGAEDVTFSATDVGSGLYRLRVYADGKPVLAQRADNDSPSCADVSPGDSDPYQFTSPRPCKLTLGGTHTIDTSRLPAGQHQLRVVVEDAPGNQATVLQRAGTIERFAESGDVYPAAVPRLNGQNAHPQASMSVHRVGSRRRVTTVRYGRRVGIAGRLRAPSGQAISGARVEVSGQARRPGAPVMPHGTIVTDAKGIFRYVAGRGPSRTLTFRYRANLDDPTHVGSQVVVRVIPRVRPRVRPRSVRNRESVIFRGHIPAAPRGAQPLVELEARKAKGWTNFDTVRLRNRRFAYRYTFTRTTRRITYTIRARVRTEPGFPYTSAYSNRVRVRVRP